MYQVIFGILLKLFYDVDIFVGCFHEQIHARYALNGFGILLKVVEFTCVAVVALFVLTDVATQCLVLLVEFVTVVVAVFVKEAYPSHEEKDGPKIFLAKNNQADAAYAFAHKSFFVCVVN